VGPLGFLQVGPDSAEARPGPACYGLGGDKPTVTDAAVVLGYIDPHDFAGGAVSIDRASARRVLGELGAEIGLSADECAANVIDVLNENMAQATRVHLAERGRDASRVHLIASGGGGPLHGAEIARRVGIPEMIIPRRPGVLSALGLVLTPPSIELAQSRMVRFDDRTDWAMLNDLLWDLERRAREMLVGTGVDVRSAAAEWSSELRWIGQTHTFRVALPPPPYGPEFCVTIVDLFTAEALRLHGLSLQETVLEALTWRVVVTGSRSPVAVEPSPATSGQSTGPTVRPVYSRGKGIIDVPVYDRSKMEPGWQGVGPALISDESSTCLIGAGDRFQVDNERGDVRVLIATRARGAAPPQDADG
jgi:N-methylhydantoinase A/oxoprolinase/acetone carboxylase beta subunit